jgi:sporulation protein YlmC with PRC-barrel domain
MQINKLAVYAITFAFIFSSAAFAAETTARVSFEDFRARELIGYEVQSVTGENLGKIDDIVFSENGIVQFLILSSAETDALIPIPFESPEFSFQENAVIAHNLDRRILEGAPSLTSGEWDRLSDPSFEIDVRSYYDQSQVSGISPRADVAAPAAAGLTAAGFDRSYRASELLNKDIHNASGEKIGEVRDLLIDEDGRVQQIVVGDVTGLVVPFDSSEFTIREDAIVAHNLDSDLTAAAPLDRTAETPFREEDPTRGYFPAAPEDRFIEDEDARPLGYPIDRHPQLDVWHPPAGHPPYGPAD